MQRLWEGWSIWHRSLFWLPLSASLIFSFYWNSWKQYRRVFILLFEQMRMQKKCVVLSHSPLFKLTQLWWLPLLRFPEVWKRSIAACLCIKGKMEKTYTGKTCKLHTEMPLGSATTWVDFLVRHRSVRILTVSWQNTAFHFIGRVWLCAMGWVPSGISHDSLCTCNVPAISSHASTAPICMTGEKGNKYVVIWNLHINNMKSEKNMKQCYHSLNCAF